MFFKVCLYFCICITYLWSYDVDLILEWTPNPCHIPLYVSNYNDFFEGLNVNIKKNSGDFGKEILLKSSTPLFIVNYPYSSMFALSNGINIKFVSSLIGVPLFGLSMVDCDDKSPKIIGNFSGTFNEIILSIIIEDGRFISKSDSVKRIGGDALFFMTLGDIDGILGAFQHIESEQLWSIGFANYFISIVDIVDIPHYHELIIIESENNRKNFPDCSEKFRRGLWRGINFCKKFPEEAFAIYSKCVADKSTKTLAWEKKSWEKIVKALPSATDDDDYAMWGKFAQWLDSKKSFNISVDKLMAKFFS